MRIFMLLVSLNLAVAAVLTPAARVVINESGCPVRTPDGAILYHARADNGNDAKPVSPSPCSSAGSI